MVPERIEREVLIEAPLEVVWAVVTDPEHVGGWFGDSAEIDLRPGGEAVLTWEKHGSALAVVEKIAGQVGFVAFTGCAGAAAASRFRRRAVARPTRRARRRADACVA